MHWLDIRTILFGHLLTSLICVTVIILTWSQTRRHFSGVGFLVLGYLLQSTDLRQSRRLEIVNRSKRINCEPPKGGYSSNIFS